jgi:CRISPR-associated endonuclease/helicase Cas3
MTEISIQFDKAFHALTDYSPMRWQIRLFERLTRAAPTKGCDLPTGLGKTSVIPIWLIALASQARSESVNLPRRLIYIVNRRTVVDQATDLIEKMRRRLLDPNNPSWSEHAQALGQVANALRSLSAGLDDLPLAISTLRGELADNEEWKTDPARAAIIIGTIDMVGSKLLFSGYGDGRYHSTHHAGLTGQDSMIIHDEAHLTPAFSDLLRDIAGAQRQAEEQRPVLVLELSATARGNDNDVFTLEPVDEKDKIVQQRLNAKKNLQFHEAAKDGLEATLAKLAMLHEALPTKVLIYVRSPESAQKVVDVLGEELGTESVSRVALLTGTIRGHERDRLARDNPVYRALLDYDRSVERTVYLVSTSAGEVGIDLDADHLVCDLTVLDSMIQRLGRVNRRGGEGRQAKIDVVVQKSEADSEDETSRFEQAIRTTRTILGRLPRNGNDTHDVSPRSLREFLKGLDEVEKIKAFSPKPAAPLLTDILLDAWSLTSITKTMPSRLEVEPYLHGLTSDPPETYVAWRREVDLLDRANVDKETLRDWFRACRIEAHERLRDRTDRVKNMLQDLLKSHRKKNTECDFPVILLNERGDAERAHLSKIVVREFNLAYRTVVLPLEAGGLTPQGTLDGKAVDPAVDADVAEAASQTEGERRRERWILTQSEEGERWERLLTGETASSLPVGLREFEWVTLRAPAEGTEEETKARHLVLMVSLKRSVLENPEIARITQTLEQHSGYIEEYAKRIAKALKLDELEQALAIAARWHDRGKARSVWQRFACNRDLANPLAKSPKYLHWRALGGFRHEFGSLLDAAADSALQNHPERDLILHLIAAHHGWGRPHFEPRAWDQTRTTQENQQAAVEVMRRFARLQQRFGRWGLAWLESLLRCADIAASKQTAGAPASTQLEKVQA